MWATTEVGLAKVRESGDPSGSAVRNIVELGAIGNVKEIVYPKSEARWTGAVAAWHEVTRCVCNPAAGTRGHKT